MNKTKNQITLTLTASAALLAGLAGGARCQAPSAAPSPVPATLSIDVGKPGPAIPPSFYGLLTEEINHSYDGGLYAELIRNRNFQDNANTAAHWSLVQDGGGTGRLPWTPPSPSARLCR